LFLSLQKKWLFFVRGFQIWAQNGVLGTKTAILAEKPDDFSARIAAAVYLLSSKHSARHQRNASQALAEYQPDTSGIPARHQRNSSQALAEYQQDISGMPTRYQLNASQTPAKHRQ
jgi:hypothetical protein